MLKEKRGITLIALVVTIIVLLILAGVSISMLTGENGVIGKASDAKYKTSAKEEKEKVSLSVASTVTEDLVTEDEITDETLRKNIKLNFDSDKNLSGTGPWIYHGEYGDYRISWDGTITEKVEAAEGTLAYMFDKAKSDGCNGSHTDGSCTNVEHLHVGDVLNLTSPNKGSITISQSESGVDWDQKFDLAEQMDEYYGNQWVVLGKNEFGEIELTSVFPLIIDNYGYADLSLYGAKAYINGERILNKICKLLKTNDGTGYISTARSINGDDVNKAVGLTSVDMVKAVNLSGYYDCGNIGDTYSRSNHFSPESMLLGRSEEVVSGKITGYYYSVGAPVEEGAPYATVNNSIIGSVLFGTAQNYPYWLASKMVEDDPDYYSVVFGLGLVDYDNDDNCAYVGTCDTFYSRGYEYEDYAYVRPVISLNASVTSSQVPIVPKTNDDE